MLLTLPTVRIRLLAATLAIAPTLTACRNDPAPASPAAQVITTPQRTAVGAGGPIEVEYRVTKLAGGAAIPSDAWVFVHMVDASGTLLWTDDHRPAALSAGSAETSIVYRRTMFVPRATPAGRVRIEVGLFSRADGARIPTAPENGATGSFEIGPASDALFVVFGDGWHAAERVPQQQANEWRWSTGDARLSFRHPRRDAELTLEVDQPVNAVGVQTVELRAGSDLLATFNVEPGVRRVHTVSLPEARMGSGPTVELDLHVRPTFVPANMPNLTSSDTRELGVRVFNVHVGAGLRAS
jgi:hypothetical protein